MKPLRILWYPKLYREILVNPKKIFATSTRMRAYNFHVGIRNNPGIKSDMLGLTVKNFEPWNYDVIVIQKTIPAGPLALKLCLAPKTFVVQDLCDPIQKELIQQIHSYADLIITSNHELSEDVVRKGARGPVETVLDNHDANPARIKQHTAKEKIRVTWYGIGDNYFHFIKPMKDVFSRDYIDFKWASGSNPKWNNEWAFQPGVEMEMSQEESWSREDSWQEFIFQTDVGVIPVMEHIKSPHKILNYMAYGIPVICTPTDSHKRIINHGVNGFLANDKSDWFKYLDVLKDPQTRTVIGNEARKTALKEFSLESIANKYLNIIEKNIQEKSSPTEAVKNKLMYALTHLRQSSVSY